MMPDFFFAKPFPRPFLPSSSAFTPPPPHTHPTECARSHAPPPPACQRVCRCSTRGRARAPGAPRGQVLLIVNIPVPCGPTHGPPPPWTAGGRHTPSPHMTGFPGQGAMIIARIFDFSAVSHSLGSSRWVVAFNWTPSVGFTFSPGHRTIGARTPCPTLVLPHPMSSASHAAGSSPTRYPPRAGWPLG